MYDIIHKRIESGAYRPTSPYPSDMKKYDEDHIFDENMSVKSNREMVAQKNKEREEALAVYQNAETAGGLAFKKDTIEYLKKDFGFNDSAAEKVFYEAYEDGHSSGYHTVLSKAHDLGDLVRDIISLMK